MCISALCLVRFFVMKRIHYLLSTIFTLALFTSGDTFNSVSARGLTADSVRFWSADSALLVNDFKYYLDSTIRHTNFCYKTSSLLDIEVYISDYKETDSKFKYHVYPVFYKHGSWIHDTALLGHAQVHFDISELYARKIRQYLQEVTNDPKKLKHVKKGIYELLEKHAVCHNVYDSETNLGKYLNMQIFWADQTNNKLDTLSKYSSPLDSFSRKQFQ